MCVETLGSSGSDIVLAKRVEHARAHESGEADQSAQAQATSSKSPSEGMAGGVSPSARSKARKAAPPIVVLRQHRGADDKVEEANTSKRPSQDHSINSLLHELSLDCQYGAHTSGAVD